MEFTPLVINGVFGIQVKSQGDMRGSLVRVWDKKPLFEDFSLIQSSFVENPKAKTLRGLHFQSLPFSENKIVYCISGKVFDVVVDLREESNTYKEHITIELGPKEKYLGLMIPRGCAHGYLTLEDNSSLLYFMDREYSPKFSKGLFWNDPTLCIKWPSEPALISERDSKWPLLDKR